MTTAEAGAESTAAIDLTSKDRELLGLKEIEPPLIFDELKHGVLGQNKALRFVSVAIFKHTTGKVPGNLLMIGNSGTGKTTIMNNIQRLYNEVPEYRPFRAVTIMNANLLVDPDRMEFHPERLLKAIEQSARSLIGEQPSPEDLQAAMERATLCIDEIDKMSAVVTGKPNPIGVVLQQGLLTLMEGEQVPYYLHAWVDGEEREIVADIDTSGMMFICGGAFEGLYDQVYNRVLKPGSGEKLRTQTIRTAEGKVKMETRFALGDYLKPKDLFDFGMVPQFLSRFDNTVLLNDLAIPVLKEILLKSYDSPFLRSRRFFEVLDVDLSIDDIAAAMIAEDAARDSRTGARALRPIFAEIVNPFEFDTGAGDHLESRDDGGSVLRITADMVREHRKKARSMLKKLALGCLLILALAGIGSYLTWRQATRLPDWYTEGSSPERVVEGPAVDVVGKASTPPASRPRAPEEGEIGHDFDAARAPAGTAGVARQPAPAGSQTASAVPPPSAPTAAPAPGRPALPPARPAPVQAVPGWVATGRLTLDEAELNALLMKSLEEHRNGRRLKNAVKGVRVSIEDDRLELGVVANLADLAAASENRREAAGIQRLARVAPWLSERDFYLGLARPPRVRDGNLIFDRDGELQVGGFTFDVADFASQLGVSDEELDQGLDLPISGLRLDDVGVGDGAVVLSVADQ